MTELDPRFINPNFQVVTLHFRVVGSRNDLTQGPAIAGMNS